VRTTSWHGVAHFPEMWSSRLGDGDWLIFPAGTPSRYCSYTNPRCPEKHRGDLLKDLRRYGAWKDGPSGRGGQVPGRDQAVACASTNTTTTIPATRPGPVLAPFRRPAAEPPSDGRGAGPLCPAMRLILALVVWFLRAVRSPRADLVLETLALRQQLAAYSRNMKQPRLKAAERYRKLNITEDMWSSPYPAVGRGPDRRGVGGQTRRASLDQHDPQVHGPKM
jgi:hypothetical protein